MTLTQKQNLITEIVSLLQAKLDIDIAIENIKPAKLHSDIQPIEMLTVKESAKAISGVSEHTIRQLIAQGRLPYVRAGTGRNGKILISKKALTEYFNQEL